MQSYCSKEILLYIIANLDFESLNFIPNNAKVVITEMDYHDFLLMEMFNKIIYEDIKNSEKFNILMFLENKFGNKLLERFNNNILKFLTDESLFPILNYIISKYYKIEDFKNMFILLNNYNNNKEMILKLLGVLERLGYKDNKFEIFIDNYNHETDFEILKNYCKTNFIDLSSNIQKYSTRRNIDTIQFLYDYYLYIGKLDEFNIYIKNNIRTYMRTENFNFDFYFNNMDIFNFDLLQSVMSVLDSESYMDNYLRDNLNFIIFQSNFSKIIEFYKNQNKHIDIKFICFFKTRIGTITYKFLNYFKSIGLKLTLTEEDLNDKNIRNKDYFVKCLKDFKNIINTKNRNIDDLIKLLKNN